MASHRSALKRMRQDEAKRLRKASHKSKVKTAIKKYLVAVTSKDSNAAELLRRASSLVQKGVGKGVFHLNTAARTISRLSKKLPPA